jgi:hypothetical protein
VKIGTDSGVKNFRINTSKLTRCFSLGDLGPNSGSVSVVMPPYNISSQLYDYEVYLKKWLSDESWVFSELPQDPNIEDH